MTTNDTLALFGGTPLWTAPIRFNNSIGEADKAAVMRVLDSGELSGFVASPNEKFWGGEEVRALEREFCSHYDVKHALGFNSASTALYAAIGAMGVGPGDEVITTPYTMSATSMAILMTGALPIYADIEDRTFGLDPASVEANITPYTKGIMAVNIYGHPARLDPLRELADKHDLFLVEDNAQAPDADYLGRKTGTIGDAGVFSFNRHKVMQSGEGGVLISDNDKIAEKAALIRNHGECVVEAFGIDDIVNTVGLNYRLTEMEAAVARVQFRNLPELNAQNINLAYRLTAGLSHIAGITPPIIEEGCSHVFYNYCMTYDQDIVGIPRDLFTKAMNAEGLYLRAGYMKPTYLEPVFQKRIGFGPDGHPFTASRRKNLSYERGICPTCERLENRDLMLTTIMQPPQTEDTMDRFVEACDKIIRNRDVLLAHQDQLAE